MKNKIWILATLILMTIGFVACSNNKNTDDNTQSLESKDLLDSKGVRDLVVLVDGEERFYLLEGKIGEDKQMAYLHIKEAIPMYNKTGDSQVPLIAEIRLPDVWNEKINAKEYISVTLDSKTIHFAKDANGDLIVSGAWNAVFQYEPEISTWEQNSIYKNQPFYFKEYSKGLNEVAFAKAGFTTTKDIKQSGDDVSILYEEVLESPFIAQDIASKDKLNAAFAYSATNINDLKEKLNSQAVKNFEKYQKDEGFKYNTQSIQNSSVDYIDDKILVFSNIVYNYRGGAHGATSNTMEAYSLANGDKISNKISDLLDINEQNKEQFLSTLNPYLQSQKDNIFSDALPLKVLPNVFFVSSKGIIFIWNTYEIAPYAAGDIRILVPYNDLSSYLKADSAFAYLFKPAQ
ncbi:hypothetical protein CCY99_04095 [Helicobacter sp. 16-1353]|uniref:DUF3298 and DUF4163 domain-containing protein n=1 Tax=Helicobacter sp. 16-1353 TaxID=2004996 RepID=UPI000DCB02A3|nr:DUF3298 and DUF4163 domain-containing protein [Helicobacter sp. 16-1353]RAX54201.1 hypothetical protein CCY99_04095 [Helicobacter sp. 16-1353]